jgi:hypothetical protein
VCLQFAFLRVFGVDSCPNKQPAIVREFFGLKATFEKIKMCFFGLREKLAE